MVTQRVVSRQEAHSIVKHNLERQVAEMYPNLSRHVRRKMVNQAAREAMRNTRGSKIILTKRPATLWQNLKDTFAPEWFISKFPVQYVER